MTAWACVVRTTGATATANRGIQLISRSATNDSCLPLRGPGKYPIYALATREIRSTSKKVSSPRLGFHKKTKEKCTLNKLKSKGTLADTTDNHCSSYCLLRWVRHVPGSTMAFF